MDNLHNIKATYDTESFNKVCTNVYCASNDVNVMLCFL